MITVRRTAVVFLAALVVFLAGYLALLLWAPFALKSHLGPVNPVSGKTIDLSHSWIQIGTMQYRAVHGRFPEHWSEVIKEGLVQAPLLTLDGKPIDPDDGRIDYPGDMIYLLGNDGEAVLRHSVLLGGQGKITDFKIFAKPSYLKILGSPVAPEHAGDLASNQQAQRLRMMGFAGVYRLAAEDYRSIYDRYPKSFEELADSGVCPLPTGSINPISGRPFKGQGADWDVLFDLSTTGELWITPVFADGERPETRLVY